MKQGLTTSDGTGQASRWDGLERVIEGVAAGILCTIWWVPPESSPLGETSWRAIVWLVLAVFWSIRLGMTKTKTLRAGTWNWLDVAMALMVAGHLLGGLQVLLSSGQKRAAANLLIEWVGLGAAWWVLRCVGPNANFRHRVWQLMVAAAVTAAALGIWQHSISLPSMAREYGPRIAAARAALAQGISTPVIQELAAAGIPTSEPGLTLFEQRLLASREPFGMFGLANTLGGLLASALLWLLVAISPRLFRGDVRQRLILLTGLGIIGWCLILTKSRTAALGFLVGVLWWVAQQSLRHRDLRLKTRHGLGIVALGIAMGAIPLLLAASGVWDWQVLSEAPKSLSYRWQYWVASSRLIQEQPFLGVGLGQFRQQYLRVKLPEASEEIADPHNLWFDAWLNGGVLSVLGLGLLGWYTWRLLCSNSEEISASPPNKSAGLHVTLGGLLAIPVLLLAQAALGAWDDRLFVLGVVFAFICAGILWIAASNPEGLTSGRAACWAIIPLVVHLHGAGGFGMSGVLLWLLMLVTFSDHKVAIQGSSKLGQQFPQTSWFGFRTVFLCLLATSVVGWLWLPDVRCRALLEQARMLVSRNPTAAMTLLKQAADVDPWNPEPFIQLGELQQQRVTAQMASTSENRSILDGFGQVEQSWQQGALRDPMNPHGWERRARTAELRFKVSRDKQDLMQAEQFWKQAVESYPTNVSYQAGWALTAENLGSRPMAIQAALQALRQDDLNRQLGHQERWLADEQRQHLESILLSSPAENRSK